jgi:ATP-dependent DNA helicase RecG
MVFLPAVLPDEAPVTEERGTKSVPSLSHVCPKSVPSDIFIPLLEIANNPISIEMLMKVAGQTNRTRFRKSILRPLLEAGLIEMTIPDKPRSSKQKYRLTKTGRELLETYPEGE